MSKQLNGNQILVGQTTDSAYGLSPSNTNLANILVTDKLSDALDKISGVLDQLAPAQSPALYTKFLSLEGTFYSARHVAATGSTAGNTIWPDGTTQSAATASDIYDYVYFGTNPVVKVADSSTENSDLATFSDGRFGYLQADIDYVSIVQRVLDPTYYVQDSFSSSDIGTWGDVLTINYDSDPYLLPPLSGFWTSLKATMSGSQSFVSGTEWDGIEHVYQISHLLTGSTPIFRFICDNGNAAAPTALTGNPYFALMTQSVTRWCSGIPSIQVGDLISASYSVSNTPVGSSYPLISRFYNSDGITRLQFSATTFVAKYDMENGIPVSGTSGIPFAYQPTWEVNGLTISVAADMFDNDAWFSFSAYNPSGVVSYFPIDYNIGGYGVTAGYKLYVDTVSDESVRWRSGNGQFPTYGTSSYQFGELYTATHSQLSIYGTIPSVSGEMLLQNGLYQYPSGDYDMNYPVTGPTYSSLYHDPVAYLTYRWATFKVSTITSKSAIRLVINDVTGITNIAQSGMLLYVTIVDSGSQVIGWIDANTVWNSGTPAVDGDAALIFVNSSATNRYVTFGSVPRTGDVWVRIGFPAGSTKSFSDITYQSV
jgi:hypothetical protein